MSAQLAALRMTVEEFLDWADARDDGCKYELEGGVVVVVGMAPERILHSRAKASAFLGFVRAIEAAGAPCEAFVEGPGVRIDADTSYEPDVVVQCGERQSGQDRELAAPVIVVEVLSPSTAYRDLGRKAWNYFKVPSVAHYLIVDADDRTVTHKRRGEGGVVLSEDVSDGVLTLHPPGLTVAVADLLPPPERDGG